MSVKKRTSIQLAISKRGVSQAAKRKRTRNNWRPVLKCPLEEHAISQAERGGDSHKMPNMMNKYSAYHLGMQHIEEGFFYSI